MLPRLTSLDLSDTAITDAAMKSLAGLPDLTTLRIDRTAVTGAGLTPLTHLQHFKELSVVGTKVDRAGITAFQRALPNNDVRWSGRGIFRPRVAEPPTIKPQPDANAAAAGPASQSNPSESAQPAAGGVAAQARQRLQDLGASVSERTDESGKRIIDVDFGDPLYDSNDWTGTDADLKLLVL